MRLNRITKETRRESLEQLDSATVRKNVLDVLSNDTKATAKEIAAILHERHLVPYPVRQAVAPRLTELMQEGKVEVCGKAYDTETERNVAVYRLVKE